MWQIFVTSYVGYSHERSGILATGFSDRCFPCFSDQQLANDRYLLVLLQTGQGARAIFPSSLTHPLLLHTRTTPQHMSGVQAEACARWGAAGDTCRSKLSRSLRSLKFYVLTIQLGRIPSPPNFHYTYGTNDKLTCQETGNTHLLTKRYRGFSS